MEQSLTVVLPVHNAEATLAGNVADVLNMASELTTLFSIFILDDGSTDDTYDTAVELAARYPQIRVMRNSQQRGLGPTLRSIRTLVRSDMVVVHDGTSSFDVEEIRTHWLDHHRRMQANQPVDATNVSIDDLRVAAAGHRAMAAAHSRLLGFQKISVDRNPAMHDSHELTRRKSDKQNDVGAIPPLPRPNFMSSLANFALGE